MEDVCNNDDNLDLGLNNVCTEELSQGSVDGNKFEKFVVGEDSKNCSLQDAFLKYKRWRQVIWKIFSFLDIFKTKFVWVWESNMYPPNIV